MKLTPASCYRALTSRDARFDGRFFTAVVTTGIYCRPVCPARTPLRRNCKFFVSAAAAEEAGFRACRRCRPEASPASAAWQGTSALVARALRLVLAGALDAGNVAELALRVGSGERHLRRLFQEQLGASPIAVAQTRRLHFAKQLLDETSLPITQVAHAAGFASVRRFNAAMSSAWGAPPRTLRKANGSGPAEPRIALRLAYRPPFDWALVADYLRARAIPGVEELTGDAYRRSVALASGPAWIAVRPAARAHQLLLDVPASAGAELGALVARVRRLFDLDADPRVIAAQLGRDARLAAHVRARPGVRVPGAFSGFELALRAILGQQVSVANASTLSGRLVALCGRPLPEASGALTTLFPSPRDVASADLTALRIPRVRAEALRGLAQAVCDGLDLDGCGDLDETKQRLLALPGIGPWTAEYVALRALGEPDAFPASDLGLRRAAGAKSKPLSAEALERVAEAWRPWRGYAALWLWTSEAARG